MDATESDTPRTRQEAIRFFADPDRCLSLLIPMRWPNDITCPHCGCKDHAFIASRRIWRCKGCKKQYSIKIGTVMEDSPLGLDKWLAGIWLIANAKNGVNSWEIHRSLKITQKSAWFLLHRIRLAMQAGSLDRLSGEVEADETFIGGKARNMHKSRRERVIQGRGEVGKSVVMGLLDRHSGKVRTRVVPDTRKPTLQAEVRANV